MWIVRPSSRLRHILSLSRPWSYARRRRRSFSTFTIQVAKEYEVQILSSPEEGEGVFLGARDVKKLLGGRLLEELGFPDRAVFFIPLSLLLGRDESASKEMRQREGSGEASDDRLVPVWQRFDLAIKSIEGGARRLGDMIVHSSKTAGAYGHEYDKGLPSLPGRGLGSVEDSMRKSKSGAVHDPFVYPRNREEEQFLQVSSNQHAMAHPADSTQTRSSFLYIRHVNRVT